MSPGVLGVLAFLLQAQEPQRPNEQDIFGAQPTAPKSAEPAKPEQPAGPQPPAAEAEREQARDQAVLGAGATTKLSEEAAPENPLAIGGMLYLRSQSSALEEQPVRDWSFAAPSLLDVYGDARPNPRVRGFVLARTFFDPTLPQTGAPITVNPLEPAGSSMGSAPLSSLFGARTRGPTVALDQMWMRFDIKHTVFVTAGKQHVRWGTARFWTPTDFLHIRRRNPLDVFDARTGTSMLKLHVPWEERGWNFYAYGVTEGARATSSLGSVAGAARAEMVLGTTEAGVGAFLQRGRKPKLAADLSTGIWDLDLYGEIALRYGSEIDRVSYDPNATLPMLGANATLADLERAVDAVYPVYQSPGVKPQTVGGVSYSHRYADKDVWTVGVEYFYNPLGYDDTNVYPGLILPHTQELNDPSTFFYLGRHYGAVFLAVPAPYNLDLHTFTLSTLGNLSDHSYISRFDYSYTLLTHLRFEAFVAVHFGHSEGEFRFGSTTFGRAPALLDLGVALRMSL